MGTRSLKDYRPDSQSSDLGNGSRISMDKIIGKIEALKEKDEINIQDWQVKGKSILNDREKDFNFNDKNETVIKDTGFEDIYIKNELQIIHGKPRIELRQGLSKNTNEFNLGDIVLEAGYGESVWHNINIKNTPGELPANPSERDIEMFNKNRGSVLNSELLFYTWISDKLEITDNYMISYKDANGEKIEKTAEELKEEGWIIETNQEEILDENIKDLKLIKTKLVISEKFNPSHRNRGKGEFHTEEELTLSLETKIGSIPETGIDKDENWKKPYYSYTFMRNDIYDENGFIQDKSHNIYDPNIDEYKKIVDNIKDFNNDGERDGVFGYRKNEFEIMKPRGYVRISADKPNEDISSGDDHIRVSPPFYKNGTEVEILISQADSLKASMDEYIVQIKHLHLILIVIP